jgi:hypothetical protein
MVLGANVKDKLPGRLQERHVSNGRDAGPVKLIDSFGISNLRCALIPLDLSSS